jgi:membrane protease YdiL (CAAX protease family)
MGFAMFRAVVFVFGAYAFSWGLWMLASPHAKGTASIVLATAYMFGPMLGAFVTGKLFDRQSLGAMIGWRFKVDLWWFIAWIAAPALAFLALWLSTFAPGVGLQTLPAAMEQALSAAGQDPGTVNETSIPSLPTLIALTMVAGIVPNSIAAFGEESGSRGYLWSVVRPVGFWKASLAVGVIWGLWHAPLIMAGHNYGVGYFGFPWSGIAMMTAFCIALSPLMGYLRDRTGSSIPAAIFHGTVNAVTGATVILLTGANIWTLGLIGIPGLIVLAALAAIIVLLRPNMAGRT